MLMYYYFEIVSTILLLNDADVLLYNESKHFCEL